MKSSSPRSLDHVVLPVPSLKVARNRFTQLGFTVAADGRHKFGTENCCIKFENGTFIEPLAIGHRETVERNAKKGNNFLRRDAAYRFRHGENGFWGISLSTGNSSKDRQALTKAGYNTGKLVTVKRKGVHAKLAFAIDERAPDLSVFMCQDVAGASKTDPALLQHANGAKRISCVTMYEHLPEDFQYYLQTAANQRLARSHSFGMEMKLQNARVSVLNRHGMKAHYGVAELPEGRGLRAVAIEIEVQDIEITKEIFRDNGVEVRSMGHRIIVDAAEGQGALIAFVEA